MPDPITAIFCRRGEDEEVKAIMLSGATCWFGSDYAPNRGADQSDPAGRTARIRADARMCPQQRSGVRQVARAAAEKGARHA
jgi:hypothetical protein